MIHDKMIINRCWGKSFPAIYITMPPNSSNDDSAYKSKIKPDLEKLNGKIQHVKVGLTQTNINTLANQLDLLSNGIKVFMISPSSNRHHALNDRTVNLLREGNIDLNAIMHQSAEPPTFSDAEISELIEQEKEVTLIAVKLEVDKQRPGGAFFSFLNKAIYDLSKYGVLNRLIEIIIITIVFFLLYKQEAYWISNYRS